MWRGDSSKCCSALGVSFAMCASGLYWFVSRQALFFYFYYDVAADIVAGSRVALSCGPDESYFSSIHECIPLSIAGRAEFLQGITFTFPCSVGEVVTTADELEAFRYCGSIVGPLTIAVADGTADYSALYDIVSIDGLT